MKNLLDPIKTESLKEVFIARFEELILSGKLSIGQTLPSERELALQLGVSRPVVHEGLVDLAFKGLVSIKPRVGTVVNDYRNQGSLALLTSLFDYNKGRIDPKLLDDLLEIRELFEVETSRLAAAYRTQKNLEEFDEILRAEQETDVGDADRIAELDFRFHHQIALASRNTIYPLLLNSFKPFYTNLTRLFFSDTSVVSIVFAFHRQIADAIGRKDPQTTAEVMRRLLEHGALHIKSNGIDSQRSIK